MSEKKIQTTHDICTTTRIAAIDFTKGMLVIFMVVYHSLNLLRFGTVPNEYLPFVAPSFIMISGFILTNIYTRKYALNTRSLSSRLAVRSFKLLLIFTLLNLLIQVMLARSYDGIGVNVGRFLGNWTKIYLFGSGRMASFEVLPPIGYILLIAIPIIKLQRVSRLVISGCAVVVVVICTLLERYGYSIYNLYLASSGIIGMAIGLLPLNRIHKASNALIWLSVVFAIYWYFKILGGSTYCDQIFATVVSLLVIYVVGIEINLERWLPEQLIMLGRYSLLSYIVQIFWLRIVFAWLIGWNIATPNLALIVVSVSVLTWGIVLCVDCARLKWSLIDGFYKGVFA